MALSSKIPTRAWVAAATCLLGLPGCSKNPFEEEKARSGDTGEDSSFVLAQGLMQGAAQAASDLHQEAAAADRVEERMEAAKEPEVKAETGV